MARLSSEVEQRIQPILSEIHGIESLKQLFWSELNYDRANQALPRDAWPAEKRDLLAEDPLVFATGGADGAFQILYCRIARPTLSLQDERAIVELLSQRHPYALFIFADRDERRWHLVNAKLDTKHQGRPVLRRIALGPGEQTRTATERLALIDTQRVPAGMFGPDPLAIQREHDKDFDVEAVSKKFFTEYGRVFTRVESAIQGFADDETGKEHKRLFTQRLFNRLMFLAFIQKKGWLVINGQTEYLAALWNDYQTRGVGDNFYRDRLGLLFFTALNSPNEVDVLAANPRGTIQDIVGQVRYLNGGLFEEDDLDKNPRRRRAR